MNNLLALHLQKAYKDKSLQHVFLLTGIRLKGIITAYDTQCIELDKHQLILLTGILSIQTKAEHSY